MKGSAFLAVGGFHFRIGGGLGYVEGMVGLIERDGGSVGIVCRRGVTTLDPGLNGAVRQTKAFLTSKKNAGLKFAHLAVLGPSHLEKASEKGLGHGGIVADELAGLGEVIVDRDIMVLANPEIAGLPAWVVGLVAAGGLAAALSTAAGLLLVISTSVAHDLFKKGLRPDITDQQELIIARVSAGMAVGVAAYFGINPVGFVAQVVAFAFGLAAASFFPAILMGIFSKRMNKEGAIAGMVAGIVFTAVYITWFKLVHPELNSAENWLFGISPEGIGAVGMLINFAIALIVSRVTEEPPRQVQALVEEIRVPRRTDEVREISV